MQLIDIYPKEVHVKAEFTNRQIKNLLGFLEKALPLYQKVFEDSEEAEYADILITRLKDMSETIEKGLSNGT
jgi:hypothetical protein